MVYYLVGMMGSGKTWYGAQLAQKLDIPFIDLDAVIVESEERSIAAIFESDGEEYFREIEAKHLRDIVIDEKGAVVSTGGGTPCFHDNMVWMNQTGNTIYLRTSVEVLAKRLHAVQQHDRPMLHGDHELQQLKDKLSMLMERREGFYLQSHETMDVEDQF
jgi:shikimate kinase